PTTAISTPSLHDALPICVGYDFANPLHTNGTTGDPSLSAKISYQPTTRLGMDISASRAFQAGVLTGASLDTNLTASVNMKLSHKDRKSTRLNSSHLVISY